MKQGIYERKKKDWVGFSGQFFSSQWSEVLRVNRNW